MISKIFCYSDSVAKRKCNVKSSKHYTMLFILFMVLSFLSIFLIVFDISMLIVFFLFFVLLVAGIYYECKLVLEMNDKMSAIAIDKSGALYKVIVIDKGAQLGLLSMSTGNLLSQLTDNDLFKSVGSSVGLFFMFNKMNKAIKVMSIPNNVAMIINDADKFTGVIVQKLTRIYKLENKKKKLVVHCDFELYKKGKIKNNKKVIIKKKYNNIEEIGKILGVDV